MKLSEYMRAEGVSQSELATRIGVSQGLVWQWLAWLGDPAKGTRITAERALEIELATGGKVTRADLRPDIYGVPALPVEKAVSNA